ncbi:malate synthase [Vibrio sp. 10N.286.49.B3]|uniref:malate synthase n=1 Tax=Vibrio sp. 10N.286.49.B3 TaxID=1880855 RepID=UPI000C8410DF|nr:malate synthase [Vibrio sp. 10N.286.49.B3]PMH43199.1 malate synthase [Vibrio sp. 10N.286.49.B3]
MNMLTIDKTEIQQQNNLFIAEAVFAVEAISTNEQSEKQRKAKQLLDQLFPLENGSHQDVTSYVIDYNHLLAYFKGGQHSGLKFPKHFVAYTGQKSQPDAMLLKDATGSHLEVILAAGQGTGHIELMDIEDIQLETCTTFDQNSADLACSAIRHWISLIKSDGRGKPLACSEDREYMSKSGQDYHLMHCYTYR